MWQKIKNIYHLFIAILANLLFLFPSRGLTVIGVTGTDGKTTTANLIFNILKNSGRKAAVISSVGSEIGNKKYDLKLHVTTPSPFSLQWLILKARFAGAKYLVLEVTSHAIDQYRIWGIKFYASTITNVTNEHLDYHKTYDNYLRTKVKLLRLARYAIVNEDDSSYEYIKKIIQPNNKVSFTTFGLSKISDINPSKYPFKNQLMIGEYSEYNKLAAAGVCRVLGLSKKEIESGVKSFKPPIGRFDVVYSKDFKVIIDFAHTPNSFSNVLSSIRKITKGRIIHVFGSAGERDRSKRPLMGEISSKYSDIIILTSEDPRSEDPNQIIEQLASGISKNIQIIRIADRKEAIETAIQIANKDDLVLITGKGHEKSINYGNGEQSWNEYKVVEDALRNRK